MAKRKASEAYGTGEPSNNNKYNEPKCKGCGSMNIIASSGDEYCGDCGAVLESIILTTGYSYESEHTTEGTQYVRVSRRMNRDDAASVRLHNRWNQEMIRQATARLTGVCRQLGMPLGVEKRAEHLFVESSKRLMEAQCDWVFGRRTDVRVAACVYMAGLESGRPVTLVDVAGAVQTSVYAIGHETKQALALLGIRLPLLDPLLRVEQAVNRVFGGVIKATSSSEQQESIIEQISGGKAKSETSRKFASQLVEFVSSGEEQRVQVIEVSGQVMAFDQLCSRTTGISPNRLVCSAVSMSLEHLYVRAPETEEGVLKRCHREVIFRLVTLFNGAGQHTVLRHVSATQKALIEAGKIVPWLEGIKLTMDNVAVHLEGILFYYKQARSLLFAIREKQTREEGEGEGEGEEEGEEDAQADAGGSKAFESAVSGVVARLSKAPSFARAEERRERRAIIMSECAYKSDTGPVKQRNASSGVAANEAQREVEVIRRLYRAGVDREALLSLPLHTLEHIGEVSSRRGALDDNGRRRLDTETVGAEDMTDDEVLAYMTKFSQNNE
ncbi:hypothetical protein IW138_003695 [Coemansia sp. RSA 986]|nr:hypothetical protein IW138_003695 [Coemansia sp. RSA 986]